MIGGNPSLTFLKRENSGKIPHIKKSAVRFIYVAEVLYKRSFNQLWLRCFSPKEARKVIKEVHEGLCRTHQSGPKMMMKIKRIGYYWPTMVKDCADCSTKCHKYLVHGNAIHQFPNPLHQTISSWPFKSWGTDIIGLIDPPSSTGHRYIFAAIDYFSKWAEANALKQVKANNVIQFFRDHIVYHFEVPCKVISDNGPAFKSLQIARFAKWHRIDWRYSYTRRLTDSG
ncbi:hypothetical protein AXF42_Ash003617 [Apostasia shenzhenica]|uniref:Integrase catalytic domain-containing protein n=1 Tax=Apostasia shenzhenica TaxID=1088818 RepID=A0A2I0AHE7_9ASPA|nr:hypothetical protein AXF42_Ash003617 [Apostasia shenzhenica]